MAQWLTALFAAAALAGQVANYVLNLKLQKSLADSENRVRVEMASIYKRQDVCAAEMARLG